MNTLRSLFALALTAIAANGMWAATQGTTHSYPLSEETTKKYLTEYLGISNYGDSNWSYTTTDGKSSNATAPTATTTGDVIFVEVNDYWQGSNWANPTNLYNQVKYGVKSINKVTENSAIGSGKLYHYDATTNRFFFAIRTSSIYSGSGASWKKINWSNKYYMNEVNSEGKYYPMPFRWYNEFSATTSTSGDGWQYLDAEYDNLKDGDFLPVPHSCSNSLEKNHFTTLYPKTSVGQTYTISAMLYVPTGTNATTNQKNGSFSSSNIPQVFFYINKLTGERVKNSVSGAACEYSSLLNWKTSFDLARAKHSDFVTYKSGADGVKEESKIYRKIEGEEDFTLVKSGLVDLKTWTDNTLPNPGAEGYSVEYYVVTEVITYNAYGKRVGKNVGTAATNHITVNIPGKEQFFELAITNDYNSKFTPVKGLYHKSYNNITNNISTAPTEFTPALSDIKVGDKFEIERTDAATGTKVVKTVVITGKSGTRWTYTVDGKSTTSTISNIQTLLSIVSMYNDQVNSIPGKEYDSKYQLVYTSGNEVLRSNIVSSKGMHTDVKVNSLYRSGTPDPINNAKQELYTIEVYFKPIISNEVAHYNIWMNGAEAVMRVGQSGTTFTLVGKDSQGNFNVPQGEIEPETDGYYKGYLKVRINASIDKKACETEMHHHETEICENDLFFTIEVVTTGGNSYGNYDQAGDYQGLCTELVYNSSAVLYAGQAGSSVEGIYRAQINWDRSFDPNMMDDDDYVAYEPDYFTVYRMNIANGETSYSPITAHYIGHDTDMVNPITGELEKAGFEILDQTLDGTPYKFTPELIEEMQNTRPEGFMVIDFVHAPNFRPAGELQYPAMYYVKAHYNSHFERQRSTFVSTADLRNYKEKNSNPTSTNKTIVTGVNDIKTSEVVNVTYYNMMGIQVEHPQEGEVVVARTQFANGAVTSKVVKM